MPAIKAFCASAADWDAVTVSANPGKQHDEFYRASPFEAAGKPAVYIYELCTAGESHTGVWALTPFDDILEGRIKGYEQRSAENDSTIKCGQDGYPDVGPALLTYPRDPGTEALICRVKLAAKPKSRRVGGQEHRLWEINDPDLLRAFTKAFSELGTAFLVGGHLPALRSGQAREHRCGGYALSGNQDMLFFSALYMADDQLRSMPCHQLLKPGFPIDTESFFQVIGKDFEIMDSPANLPVVPERAHRFGLCLNSRWYLLILKQHVLNEASFTGRLDGNILYNHIFSPARLLSGSARGVTGIGGPESLAELTGLLAGDPGLVAFTLYPASLNQLMSVAYTDGTLPPGTTWIGPRVPSGLLNGYRYTEASL